MKYVPRRCASLRAFNTSQVWLALAIGAVGFAGMFCVFHLPGTDPWCSHRRGRIVDAAGGGRVRHRRDLGNIAGGWLVDKFHFKAAAVVLLWSIVMLPMYRWPHSRCGPSAR